MRTVYDHGLPPNDMGTVLLPDRRRCVSRARTVRRNACVRQRTGQEISVFDYTQVIFSAVLGFFLFGQLPDGWSVLGYLLICGISVAVFFYNRNLERKGQ